MRLLTLQILLLDSADGTEEVNHAALLTEIQGVLSPEDHLITDWSVYPAKVVVTKDT